MEREKRIGIYSESYSFELQRKDRLSSMISIPTGIVTLLFGAVGYFYRIIPTIDSPYLSLSLCIAVAVMFIILLFASISLIKSYFGYTYSYLPTSRQLEDYWNELSDYQQLNGVQSDEIEDDFKNFLIQYYCDANEINIANNDKKSGYFHKANQAIVAVLVLAFLFSIPIYWNKIIDTGSLVVNKLNSSRVVKEMGQNPNEQKPQQPANPQKPQKPTPPPMRKFSESDISPKKPGK